MLDHDSLQPVLINCFYADFFDKIANLIFILKSMYISFVNYSAQSHRRLYCIFCSDQCFPACLPASSGGQCCAIIRVEDGGLHKIIAATRNILGGKKLPVGSVILLCSASHLARVGTAKYASDLVDCFKAIESEYGNSVRAVQCARLPYLQVRAGRPHSHKEPPGHHGLAGGRGQAVPGTPGHPPERLQAAVPSGSK